MTVAGRHVIVTGGGSGVGAALADRFARADAKVTILGRRRAPLEHVASRIGAHIEVCDVTDVAAMGEAMIRAVAARGPVEVAVANAGAAESMPFAKMTADDLTAMLSVNLAGTFNLFRAVYPGMKTLGWGRLIAVASTAGLKGYPYVSAYCAAKHGVVGMVRALALELAKTGVTVNAICPGFIDTPLLDRSIAKIVETTGVSAEDASRSLRANNPQGRFIETDEVAGAALWLCSDAARSVNGHALTISGGEI